MYVFVGSAFKNRNNSNLIEATNFNSVRKQLPTQIGSSSIHILCVFFTWEGFCRITPYVTGRCGVAIGHFLLAKLSSVSSFVRPSGIVVVQVWIVVWVSAICRCIVVANESLVGSFDLMALFHFRSVVQHKVHLVIYFGTFFWYVVRVLWSNNI